MRWAKSDQVLAEEYRKLHPELFADLDHLLDLIYNEICLREQAGDEPSLAEYQRRFPELAEPLRLQFEVHLAIESDADSSRTAIPGYELLAEIGHGGMGLVYKARDLRLDRIVAVKVIRPELAGQPDVRKRFLTEARAASTLDHLHIVKVHEVGDCAAGPFLVMEFIEGVSLESLLRQGPLPIAQAVQIAITLAEAVQHAHQNGIIHRDLKPANILLVSGGVMSGELPHAPVTTHQSPLTLPKITDFGLAKLLTPPGQRHSSTKQGTMLGTPAYMPPEQLGERRQTPGPWNDVYALGGILFAMLTGKPPYDEGNFVATVLRVRAALEPPELRPLRSDVPEDLERICRKCLQKSTGARFPSAQALAEELRRIAPTLAPALNATPLKSAWLTPASGGEPIALDKSVTTIGRARDCDIRLTEPEVSRRHCRIVRTSDRLFVEDLGSQHGIRINGQTTNNGPLQDGDHLELGPVEFIVRLA